MNNRIELKNQAKNIFNKNISMYILLILMMIIFSMISIIPFIGIIFYLSLFFLSFIFSKIILKTIDNKEIQVKDVLNLNGFSKYIKTVLWIILYSFIYGIPYYMFYGIFIQYTINMNSSNSTFNISMLIFSLIGMLISFIFLIIKLIPLEFAQYIAIDDEYILSKTEKYLTSRQCLQMSKSILKGHLREYIILIFSFIPWLLICLITCGIASIFLIPYMSISIVLFYRQLLDITNLKET